MTEEITSQRLDRWLYYARFFKTRSLAGKTISATGARVTRHGQTQHTEKASFNIRINDVVAINHGERIIIAEILQLNHRRGPAVEAKTLYTDLSPPPIPRAKRPVPPMQREVGTGRPTKKDRRALEAFHDRADPSAFNPKG